MNINSLREATPGTKNVIHFNNAGASLMPKPVFETVISYLEQEVNFGGYETAQHMSDELDEVYPTIANFINAGSEEIAILENATAAWNMAFSSIDFKDGDHIFISVAEYASNYIAYLRLQRDVNVQIDVIPNDRYGQTSVDELKNMVHDKVKLISITHIPTNGGLVNPAEEIGLIAKESGCLYLLDACQSVGQYPVDVQQIGCDMLSATGRKYLRGPRGTGFLYANKEKLPKLTPYFLDLHSAEWVDRNQYKIRNDARRFENWEANYAGILGLKTAVKYADNIGIENIWNRITKLAEELRWQLAELPNIKVRDLGETKCGIVTFTVDSFDAKTLHDQLAREKINVSISTKNSTLLDMQERQLNELVRASVHYYNTEEEITDFIEVLKKIAVRT